LNLAAVSQVYKCSHCGIVAEVLSPGDGTLTCCNEPMVLLEENTTDAAQEKHVPVIDKIDGGVKVTVGSVAHPMGDDHYIEWIEILAGGKTYRQALNPGDTPEAIFAVDAPNIVARASCNLHGLWKA